MSMHFLVNSVQKRFQEGYSDVNKKKSIGKVLISSESSQYKIPFICVFIQFLQNLFLSLFNKLKVGRSFQH